MEMRSGESYEPDWKLSIHWTFFEVSQCSKYVLMTLQVTAQVFLIHCHTFWSSSWCQKVDSLSTQNMQQRAFHHPWQKKQQLVLSLGDEHRLMWPPLGNGFKGPPPTLATRTIVSGRSKQERGDANRIDLNPKCCMFFGWNLNIILYCVVFQQPKRSTFWGWCQDRYNSPRAMYLWHFVSTDTSCCYAPRKFHDGTGLLSTPPRRLLSCQAKTLFSRIDWRPTTCLWSSSINSFNEYTLHFTIYERFLWDDVSCFSHCLWLYGQDAAERARSTAAYQCPASRPWISWMGRLASFTVVWCDKTSNFVRSKAYHVYTCFYHVLPISYSYQSMLYKYMLNLFDSPMGPISEKNTESQREAESETEREETWVGTWRQQRLHVIVCVTVRHPCVHPSGRLRFFVLQQVRDSGRDICCKDPSRTVASKDQKRSKRLKQLKSQAPFSQAFSDRLTCRTCKNKSLTWLEASSTTEHLIDFRIACSCGRGFPLSRPRISQETS